ncbi:MAG: lysophospholipase [Proteobacteria bacterium]|nr:lysophospholipase [Pseudomonadota bacterium]
MIDVSKIDYSELDVPQLLQFLFYPRAEFSEKQGPGIDLLIPVEAEVRIGARFHLVDYQAANILFFHGNGEIVSDYDEMAEVFNRLGLNFLPVDYRGYGRSTGSPTVTGMMRDCHVIFDYAKQWLGDEGYKGPMILMGRSLGSASVLELVSHYAPEVDGLIVESGFAFAGPLLSLIGINVDALGSQKDAFSNVEKIKAYSGPTLIIHAEYDHIIPFSDGKALYQASPSEQRQLLMIPGANHNDIHFRGLREYMTAVKVLADLARERRAG